jgi:hypothetical protein
MKVLCIPVSYQKAYRLKYRLKQYEVTILQALLRWNPEAVWWLGHVSVVKDMRTAHEALYTT